MKDELVSVRQAIEWTVKNCPNAPYVPVKREVLESLEAKLEKAREALGKIATGHERPEQNIPLLSIAAMEIARAALKELSQ